MDLTLEQRLLRFLAREEDGERRSHRELQAQPVEVRVLEGECIQHARYLGRDGASLRFHAPENTSKFRSGDAVLVGDGHDFVAAVPLVYAAYDGARAELRLERDPWQRAEGEFEAGRPAGLRAGTPVDAPLVVPFGPLVLEEGRYEIRLTIDGETKEDWFVAFTVRNAPAAV